MVPWDVGLEDGPGFCNCPLHLDYFDHCGAVLSKTSLFVCWLSFPLLIEERKEGHTRATKLIHNHPHCCYSKSVLNTSMLPCWMEGLSQDVQTAIHTVEGSYPTFYFWVELHFGGGFISCPLNTSLCKTSPFNKAKITKSMYPFHHFVYFLHLRFVFLASLVILHVFIHLGKHSSMI